MNFFGNGVFNIHRTSLVMKRPTRIKPTRRLTPS
jgi:hypothetical protein